MCALAAQNVGAAFAKQIFPLVGAEGIAALRVGISACLLLAWFRPWRISLERHDALNLLIYGLGMGCMNLFIYHAFARIPIGIAVAIEVTGPLAVVLFSSRRPRDFLWLGCVSAGLYLLLPIHAQGAGLDPVGVGWALAAAICWAMYIVFGKRVSHLEGGQAVAWGMFAAAAFTAPVGAAHSGVTLLMPSILLIGTAVAVLSSAIPYFVEMQVMRRLPRRVFGILVSTAPAIAALAGWVILGERLSAVQWLAIGLIILASVGAAATAGKRQAAVIEP
ncbi:MAG: EamA family transporter [Candidatus Dactylopiibacterium carminicum]|uniref:EamA family transporter n=2 Tax=Candidatus Dactylopiibacterium carminicum TaxID=857335 RepID=A0A272EPQ7_9RHOO|nr:EamA family transporter [Candidatus Dactylopiibacterium carminicum]PAS92061.1 MAG: EamA family transporter [Candidatus Dactylopiibacterium carminicum]PAS95486.1 MAG: EamA family transporter [Candidatus Dactylopiibacterium carminicum]PAS97391.1 MAG: EamA family transporter [Candidatus Dactylopiibacterium carminicum]